MEIRTVTHVINRAYDKVVITPDELGDLIIQKEKDGFEYIASSPKSFKKSGNTSGADSFVVTEVVAIFRKIGK